MTNSACARDASSSGPGGAALVVMPDLFTQAHHAPIISARPETTYRRSIRNLSFTREGGLLSYGVDQVDTWCRAATYVDRILCGAKPAELPVQLPTKFEMAMNLKTAKALGLVVPTSILLRAERDDRITEGASESWRDQPVQVRPG